MAKAARLSYSKLRLVLVGFLVETMMRPNGEWLSSCQNVFGKSASDQRAAKWPQRKKFLTKKIMLLFVCHKCMKVCSVFIILDPSQHSLISQDRSLQQQNQLVINLNFSIYGLLYGPKRKNLCQQTVLAFIYLTITFFRKHCKYFKNIPYHAKPTFSNTNLFLQPDSERVFLNVS